MKISDYYKEIQLEVAQDAYKSTCHFLTIKDKNPVPYGSGVFIEVDNVRFLITAAHVVENRETEIHVGIGRHELLRLGGEYTINSVSGDRENDRIDIAILKLNQETIEKLGSNYIFLKQTELVINHEFQLFPMYTSVGFPASRSKYNSYKKELKSRPFIYTTIPAESAIYEKLNCKTFSNVIVHYNKQKVQDYSTGTLITGPDPFGISGSGLWFTPIQVKGKGEYIDKKLVAIMTEWPIENKKCWIGTRIDVITEVIRQKYNLSLETSKLLSL